MNIQKIKAESKKIRFILDLTELQNPIITHDEKRI